MSNQNNFILCLYKNIIEVYVYGKGVTFEVLWFRYMGSNPSISYPSQLFTGCKYIHVGVTIWGMEISWSCPNIGSDSENIAVKKQLQGPTRKLLSRVGHRAASTEADDQNTRKFPL